MKFSTIALSAAAIVASVSSRPLMRRDVNAALIPEFGVTAGQSPDGTGYVARASVFSRSTTNLPRAPVTARVSTTSTSLARARPRATNSLRYAPAPHFRARAQVLISVVLFARARVASEPERRRRTRYQQPLRRHLLPRGQLEGIRTRTSRLNVIPPRAHTAHKERKTAGTG